MVARTDVAGAPALLQELLHHAQRHPVAMGDLFASALLLVVGRYDSFAQVQGEGSHHRSIPRMKYDGYSFI